MKGFPLVQWLLFVAIWGLLLWPLSALTSHKVQDVPAQINESPQQMNAVWASLRFAHIPDSFQLLQGGRVVWEERNDIRKSLQKQIELEWAGSLLELELQVEWPDDTGITAAECRLAPDSMDEKSAVFWGRGKTAGLLVYDWRGEK